MEYMNMISTSLIYLYETVCMSLSTYMPKLCYAYCWNKANLSIMNMMKLVGQIRSDLYIKLVDIQE